MAHYPDCDVGCGSYPSGWAVGGGSGQGRPRNPLLLWGGGIGSRFVVVGAGDGVAFDLVSSVDPHGHRVHSPDSGFT